MTTVLSILEKLEKDQGLKLEALEKSLKLTKKKDKDNLFVAINALKKLGIIKDIDKQRLAVNNDNNFIKGKVRCSSKGYCFVVRDDQGEDIYIRESDLNNAWHGDLVLVKITKEGHKRRAPEGSIQCVIKRSNTTLLTKIELSNSNGSLIAYPLDDRIPTIIDIDDEDKIFNNNTDKDTIYEIKITKYAIAQYNAIGKIVRGLSLNSGTLGDIEILLSKNNLSKKIQLPKVSPKKLISKGREDLTFQKSLLFKSWESSNSPYLPALYAEPFDGGTKIWIHSPTVAERINIGGRLDHYLKEKAEIICLGEDWKSFLNESLIQASEFKLNEECESLTLMIEITNKGIINDWNFSLSKIKPVHIITSKHLKTLNKRKSTSKSIPIAIKPIKDSLELIYTILHTSKLVNKIDNGSVELDLEIPNLEKLSELQKTFPSRDFHGWCKAFDIEDSQSIIDIFIRLSNNILARHLIGYKLPFIYKEHEDIDQTSINELSKSALSLDKKITLNIDGTITTNELLKSFETSTEKKILHKLVKHIIPGIHLKLYTCEADINNFNDESNFVQQDKIESPWCCPSLNYWNIFNQFSITTLLADGKNKASSRSKIAVDLGRKDSWNEISWDIFSSKVKDILTKYANKQLIQDMNEFRKNSKSFRNNIISIAQCREAQKIIGKEVPAVITGVQSYGFFAEIQELTAEGLVHVSTLGDDWYEYRSRQNLLVGRKSKKTYQLAQKINVRVLKVDILKNQIDLELVNPNKSANLISNDISNEIKSDLQH